MCLFSRIRSSSAPFARADHEIGDDPALNSTFIGFVSLNAHRAILDGMRSLAERLLRPVVVRRRLEVGRNRVAFYASASAGLKFLFKPSKDLDPDLVRNAFELVQTDDVVWDVGANVGMFSVCSAAIAGKSGSVFAFEPDPQLVSLLRRTSSLQPSCFAHIEVVPVAVARALALRTFAIAGRSRAANALSEYGMSEMGGVRDLQLVPTFPLDWFLSHLPAPTVLKIDVEGAELEVLQGAARLLREARPRIVCEVNPAKRAEITELLRDSSYELYSGLLPKSAWKIRDLASWNTIAIPTEQATNGVVDAVAGQGPA